MPKSGRIQVAQKPIPDGSFCFEPECRSPPANTACSMRREMTWFAGISCVLNTPGQRKKYPWNESNSALRAGSNCSRVSTFSASSRFRIGHGGRLQAIYELMFAPEAGNWAAAPELREPTTCKRRRAGRAGMAGHAMGATGEQRQGITTSFCARGRKVAWRSGLHTSEVAYPTKSVWARK